MYTPFFLNADLKILKVAVFILHTLVAYFSGYNSLLNGPHQSIVYDPPLVKYSVTNLNGLVNQHL
jgi:hypothetical protein